MPLYLNFSYKTCLEVGFYIIILFLVVPIKIENDYEIREQFLNYKQKFNKTYPDEATFNVRLAAFKNSLATIDLLNRNSSNGSAQYGLTKFSDLTPEEFVLVYNKNPIETNKPKSSASPSLIRRDVLGKQLPNRIDWRDKGVVGNIHSQGECGACWAFATVETIESMQAIKGKTFATLSTQQMIDCCPYNRGCNGGDVCLLLEWLSRYNVSIKTEADYPLKLQNQACQNSTASTINQVRVLEYLCQSFIGRERTILEMLAKNGPVIAGINARQWQHYVGGVVKYHCNGNVSHAVQIVGYDLTAPIPYYIVRNSWGEDFGDKGYLYISIGSNMCGIAQEVAALTVA